MNEQKNMIFFVIILISVMVGWQYFYEAPRQQKAHELAMAQKTQEEATSTSPVVAAPPVQPVDRQEAIQASSRIEIDTQLLQGSINMKGGVIDALTLLNYKTTTAKNSGDVDLLSPKGTA